MSPDPPTPSTPAEPKKSERPAPNKFAAALRRSSIPPKAAPETAPAARTPLRSVLPASKEGAVALPATGSTAVQAPAPEPPMQPVPPAIPKAAPKAATPKPATPKALTPNAADPPAAAPVTPPAPVRSQPAAPAVAAAPPAQATASPQPRQPPQSPPQASPPPPSATAKEPAASPAPQESKPKAAPPKAVAKKAAEAQPVVEAKPSAKAELAGAAPRALPAEPRSEAKVPAAPAPAPTRMAEPAAREPGASKAAASSPLRSVDAAQAGGAVHAAAVKDAVTPRAKLPEFPPPAGERMPDLIREEARRAAIRAKEEMRRGKELERLAAAKDEIATRRMTAQWAAEDALEYRTDPDDEELEVYPANAPYAYVQIVRNRRTHDTIYHVIEPRLTREERLLLDFIEGTMVDVLDLKPEELDREDLADYIRKKFDQVAEDYSLRLGDEDSSAEESRARLLYYVLRDFIGEGPIDVFTRDAMIEDISCDGPHQPMFIYHRKYESMTTTVRWRDHPQLDSFVIRLAQRAGKHVSIAEPILDATMRDGSRLQATLAKEVSTFGSTFTIRKFRDVPFSPVDLVRFGTMSSQMLAYLWLVIANRQSGIYSGGTASGKTTAINAIMLFIPPSMKVITIEDTRELSIPQPNWIAGLTRGGFGPRDTHGRQAGEIDMFQLLKNALRQRPEYIIVGEVRGAEAYNLFQAMATGHAAYGTMHADSVDAVIHRLESDPINIPRSLLEALDVVAVQIQTRVGGKRVRRTKQITEIVGLDPNTREILTNEVFHWEPSNDQFIFSGVSYSLERIAVETGVNLSDVMAELEDRKKVIEWMVATEIREYKLVAHIISVYFFDKEKVLSRVRGGLPWQD